MIFLSPRVCPCLSKLDPPFSLRKRDIVLASITLREISSAPWPRDRIDMANEGGLYFEMPPIIGDPSLPFKRAIQVVSADLGQAAADFRDPAAALKHLTQVVLRLPMPDSLLFHAALESEQKFPYANLIIRTTRDPVLFSDIAILEMRNIQVILFEEYHGDIVVGLEFRNITVTRGSFFLFFEGLKAYKKIRRTFRNLPGF